MLAQSESFHRAMALTHILQNGCAMRGPIHQHRGIYWPVFNSTKHGMGQNVSDGKGVIDLIKHSLDRFLWGEWHW